MVLLSSRAHYDLFNCLPRGPERSNSGPSFVLFTLSEMKPVALLFLTLSIVSEVAGTAGLKVSAGFGRLGPSVLALLGYALAFYFLAALRLGHISSWRGFRTRFAEKR